MINERRELAIEGLNRMKDEIGEGKTDLNKLALDAIEIILKAIEDGDTNITYSLIKIGVNLKSSCYLARTNAVRER